MKHLYTILFSLAATIWLQAQITVTNTTFPVAGDSLKTAVDLNPSGIVISPAGGPFAWDFTSLTPDVNQVTVFQDASVGAAFANFPDANLVTISLGTENYYSFDASSFNSLGFSGADPTGGGIPIQTDFKFSTPVPERRSPLNFIDNHIVESSLNLTIPVDSALAALLAQIGIPAGAVDSLRISGTASRFELVDAYGTLSIPGGTYDVLREKRTEYRDTHVEIHTFFGWVDVTSQAGNVGGFGQDTVTTYNFISNTEKEYIATVTTDLTGATVQQVEYKDNGIPNAVEDPASSMPQVVVSPNPTVGEAVFTLENFKPGSYSLQLLDTRGAVVLTQQLTTENTTVSLAGLSEGTYFYRLTDALGRLQTSGKVLKINR